MNEDKFYLAFSCAPGIGPKKFEKLLLEFGSAKRAWNSSGSRLEQVLGKTLNSKFESFRNKFDIVGFERQLKKQKIGYVSLNNKNYPKNLKKIPNPPIVLYVKGDRALLHSNVLKNIRMIAVVGTRKITSYGKEVTKMFVEKLAESGLVIVSGMAYGVDGISHSASLDVNGKTIAILGNGVDLPYPRENTRLYEEILDKKGLIISEFPPGIPPSVGTFPSRNRIIAGLSDAVLVTEGASDSGSIITAEYGLEFGRKVFAVPGPVTSNLSAAPLKLIEKGAKLVVGPDDIIRELGIKNYESRMDKKQFVGLSKEESSVVKLLENESLSFDEIVQSLKLDPSKTAATLSVMEIKGIIVISGGSYSII